VGFSNPLLYFLAGSQNSYAANFHDAQGGTNPASSNSNVYYTAGVGYDLVTGLGSPTAHLISELAAPVVPPSPGCVYSASSAAIGELYVQCTPDANSDPIYIFQQTGSVWTFFYDYQIPQFTLGGQKMKSGIASGSTYTFLACTWNSADFPSQSGWLSAIAPGLFGCDPTTTQVTVPQPPACVPVTNCQVLSEGGLQACGTWSDGCGGTINCGTTCPSGQFCDSTGFNPSNFCAAPCDKACQQAACQEVGGFWNGSSCKIPKCPHGICQ
jgi:hypothetical protein